MKSIPVNSIFILFLSLIISKASWAKMCPELFSAESAKVFTAESYLRAFPLETLVNKNTGSVDVVHTEEVRYLNHQSISMSIKGQEVAIVEFAVKERLFSPTLNILYLYVAPEYRKQGVSTYLMARVLAKNSSVEVIENKLAEDNFKVFRAAYSQYKDVRKSIQSTPAHRANIRLGFSEVKSGWVDMYYVRDFRVTRPKGKKQKVIEATAKVLKLFKN